MSITALGTIQIDKETKHQAEAIARSLKTTVNTVAKDLLTQFIKTKGKNYIVREEKKLTPSPYLQKIIIQARKNREHGKGSPVFDNAKDAIAFLHEQTK